MTKAEYAKTRFDFYRSLGYVPFAVCWQWSYGDAEIADYVVRAA